eukprot:37094-Rhodomonas_salina.1
MQRSRNRGRVRDFCDRCKTWTLGCANAVAGTTTRGQGHPSAETAGGVPPEPSFQTAQHASTGRAARRDTTDQ